MNYTLHKICAWCGPVAGILFFAGWFQIPAWQFLPPPTPETAQADLVQLYADYNLRIKFGFVIVFSYSLLFVPWANAVAAQVRRIEGDTPVMADTINGFGIFIAISGAIPGSAMLATAYRPDLNPEILSFMNDWIWILFIGWIGPLSLFCLALGVAILLADRLKNTLFPRWFGYLCCWQSVFFLGGIAVVFFTSGPFAWDGLIGFWLPLVTLCITFPVTIVLILRNIDKMQQQDQTSA